MTDARRSYRVTLMVGLVGGAAVAWGAARPWFSAATTSSGGTPAEASVTGAEAQPVVAALGFVLLAGVGGIIATRGIARRFIGLLMLAAGVVVSVASMTTSPDGAQATINVLLAEQGAATTEASRSWVSWLCVAGGGIAAAAGAAAAAPNPDWPTMGSRYDSPAASRPVVVDDPETMDESDWWRALDEGRDPTP